MKNLSADDYKSLTQLATRHSRVAGEAEDLLHDALAVAVEQGRLDVTGADRPWLVGVLANLGAKHGRSASRRRQREQTPRPGATPPPTLPDAAFLQELPKSARTVAALALSGMTRDEIRYVLNLSDDAYRQRLSVVRKAWHKQSLLPPRDPEPADAPDLDFGLIRQALLDPARRRQAIGAHDPDGNLFLFSSSQNATPREPQGEADA